MPKHLKATYLADQEYLLEETRATKLYYFPVPILWTLVWGLASLAAAGGLYGGFPTWGALSGYLNFSKFWSNLTVQMYVTLFWVLLFVIGLLWILIRFFRWISTVYAVTSRRVILQKGILGRNFDEIPVTQVRGVDVHQSFLQRILGYGTVRVSSEGGSRVGNEDWEGIPKPFRFQKDIENATQNLTNPTYPAAPPPAAAPVPPR
ncbi:MAG TPA: PH domain-containing protein [Thermoplasmata archaeon]|nr:PH domain-containing protein [Thermoplasmata archaeon]